MSFRAHLVAALSSVILIGVSFDVDATEYSSATIHETDFTGGTLESSVTLGGTELAGNGITIIAGGTEGTVEIPITAADVVGKQIQLDLERVNLISDGGFDNSSGSVHAMPAVGSDWFGLPAGYSPHTDCAVVPSKCGNRTVPVANEWFPQIHNQQEAGAVSGRRKISNKNGFAQIVPVFPGEDYYLTFEVNTAYLFRDDAQRPVGVEKLNVHVSFLDANFAALAFFDPRPNGTSGTAQGGAQTTYQTMATYGFEDSLLARKRDPSLTEENAFVKKTVRLRSLDCDDHVMYEGGSVVTSDSLVINHCTADGSPDGAPSFEESDVKYMAVDFASSSKVLSTSCGSGVGSAFASGTCSGSILDNVKLDPIGQVTMELVDANGAVQNFSDGTPIRSHQDKGFYLDPGKIGSSAAIAKLRVTLKAYGDFKPTLKKIALTTGVDVSVSTVSATPLITRDGPTFSTVPTDYAPYPEYDLRGDFAEPTLRSLCESVAVSETGGDPSARDTGKTCLETMLEHNMGGMTPILSMGSTPIRWDETLQDYYVGWKSGEIVGANPGWSNQQVLAGHLKRAKELADAGFSISYVFGAVSHGTAYTENAILIGDALTFDKVCPFPSAYDDTPSGWEEAYWNATASQRSCCFASGAKAEDYVDGVTAAIFDSDNDVVADSDNDVILTGFRDWGNFQCPVGVLNDHGGTRTGYDQAAHLVKKYAEYYYDLYDGAHSLELKESATAATTTFTLPRSDDFLVAGEVNDNHLSTKDCVDAPYWSFSTADTAYSLCRGSVHVAKCPSGATCKTATGLWNEIAAHLKGLGRRQVTVQVPQTNKRYSNPAELVDVLWYEEILPDLTPANFDDLASSTVVAGFWHPEDIYDQYDALKNVAQSWEGEGTVTLNFNDVRASNAWSFDPGCEGFLDGCAAKETSVYNPVSAACVPVSPSGSSLDDSYYAGSDCAVWSETDVAACRTDGAGVYSHYGRGLGPREGQNVLARLTLVGLSLPSKKLVYQGNAFTGMGLWTSESNPGGDVCWQTLRDANATIFERSATRNTGDLYAQEAPSEGAAYDASYYGDNPASVSHQILHYYLGDASPYETDVTVNEQIWELDGETYYAAILQDKDEPTTFFLAAWWMPEYIYGYQPLSLYDINAAHDNMFQFLSPYIDDGYAERRLVNAHLPGFASVSGAKLIPLDGSAASEVSVQYAAASSDVVLASIPVGELPVLVKLTGATLGTPGSAGDPEPAVEEPAEQPTHSYWPDADSDGYTDERGAPILSAETVPPVGYAVRSTAPDCDDANASVHPGAAESCADGGIDSDCDGDASEAESTDAVLMAIDMDGDGWRSANTVMDCDGLRNTGCDGVNVECNSLVSATGGDLDCNDSDARITPASVERCDGVDNNCNGSIDEGVTRVFCYDGDRDGYGDANKPRSACVRPPRHVANCADRNDRDAAVH